MTTGQFWPASGELPGHSHDEYATEAYVDSRTPKITTGTVAPPDPADGDVWIDTN